MNRIMTLTLSPAFDRHCFLSSFLPERENFISSSFTEAGGKGVNVSRALLQNGIDCFSLVLLGEENGPEFRALLEKDGLSPICLSVPGRIRENLTLHPSDSGETRISFSGFSASSDVLKRVTEEVKSRLGSGDYLTLTGSVPSGIPMPEILDFVHTVSEIGIKTVIDSRSFSLSDLISAKPFLIKPNREEISRYLGKEISDFSQLADSARSLFLSGVSNVMISLGSEGALLCCSAGVFVARPPKISPLSTIGAGDSSIAGFLSASLSGLPAAGCLARAVAFGSASCLRPGTLPPFPADVSKLLPEISVEKIG